MKIVATADIHGKLPDPLFVPKCDVFIIAGDISCMEDHSSRYQNLWFASNAWMWLENLILSEICGYILLIAGNHDFGIESENGQVAMRHLPKRVTYLQDEGIEIDGKTFWGTPWTEFLPRWAFQANTDGEAKEKLKDVPANLDVLISHGPPNGGYGDRLKYNGGYVGSLPLHECIIEKKPKIVICGHIHEGFGSYQMENGTDVYNVSYLDEMYEEGHGLVQLEI